MSKSDLIKLLFYKILMKCISLDAIVRLYFVMKNRNNKNSIKHEIRLTQQNILLNSLIYIVFRLNHMQFQFMYK